MSVQTGDIVTVEDREGRWVVAELVDQVSRWRVLQRAEGGASESLVVGAAGITVLKSPTVTEGQTLHYRGVRAEVVSIADGLVRVRTTRDRDLAGDLVQRTGEADVSLWDVVLENLVTLLTASP